jgi:hypothetical protein
MMYDEHHLSFGYTQLISQYIKDDYDKQLSDIGLPIP